jgi:hypothetical protein
MSGKYRPDLLRRSERQWTERMKSVGQTAGKIVVAAMRTLQRALNHDGVLIPVPVRAAVDRRQLDRSRRRD